MMMISDLPEHLQQRLRSELKPGEVLVWTSQPKPDRYMKSGFKNWLFFVPWTAFSLFWMAGASGFQMPQFNSGMSLFPLFGIPFVLIGVGGLGSPLWMRRKALSIIYAVTDQRAITIEGKTSITVRSYLAADILNIERTENPDGSGDLVLRSEQYRDSDGDRQTKHYGFFSIDDVRRVESLVAKLVQSNRL